QRHATFGVRSRTDRRSIHPAARRLGRCTLAVGNGSGLTPLATQGGSMGMIEPVRLRGHRSRAVALLAAATLIAAACGSDDNGSGSATTVAAGTTAASSAPTTTASGG